MTQGTKSKRIWNQLVALDENGCYLAPNSGFAMNVPFLLRAFWLNITLKWCCFIHLIFVNPIYSTLWLAIPWLATFPFRRKCPEERNFWDFYIGSSDWSINFQLRGDQLDGWAKGTGVEGVVHPLQCCCGGGWSHRVGVGSWERNRLAWSWIWIQLTPLESPIFPRTSSVSQRTGLHVGSQLIPLKTLKNTMKKHHVRLLLLLEVFFAPVDKLIGSLSQYFQGFMHARWCRISSIKQYGWMSYPPWNERQQHLHIGWNPKGNHSPSYHQFSGDMLVLGRVNRFVVITCFGWWVGVQGSKIEQLRIVNLWKQVQISLEKGRDFIWTSKRWLLINPSFWSSRKCE